VTDEPILEPDVATVRTVSLGAALWVGAAALFIGLRVAAVLNLPVAGAELEHLSGAWQASIGVNDGRFVPTFFQALSALLLQVSDSEMPSRWLALAATASIPVAVYLLRGILGQAGALIALTLLAVDVPGLMLGSTASAMGFDVAATAWLAVLLLRGSSSPAVWAAAGVAAGGTGPLALPLLGAAVAVNARRGSAGANGVTLGAFALGAAAAIIACTTRFGLGLEGLVLPPFDLLAAGFSDNWLTISGAEAMVLYALPLVIGGVAATTLLAADTWRMEGERPMLLVAWVAVAGGWFVIGSTANSTVALAALTLPICLVLGPALARSVEAASEADWRPAAWALPVGLAGLGIGLAFLAQWAVAEDVGSSAEVAGALLASLIGAGALALLARTRGSTATVLPAALLLAVPWGASGAFHLAFGPGGEPLASPYSPAQARELRDDALEIAAGRGPVAVHPSLSSALTWPFRDSGTILVTSRVPESARVLIWPADEPFPEELKRLSGNWALTRDVPPPTDGFLAYLHWYLDRNRLADRPLAVAVYIRTGE
jgi:hypothetical protein